MYVEWRMLNIKKAELDKVMSIDGRKATIAHAEAPIDHPAWRRRWREFLAIVERRRLNRLGGALAGKCELEIAEHFFTD